MRFARLACLALILVFAAPSRDAGAATRQHLTIIGPVLKIAEQKNKRYSLSLPLRASSGRVRSVRVLDVPAESIGKCPLRKVVAVEVRKIDSKRYKFVRLQ